MPLLLHSYVFDRIKVATHFNSADFLLTLELHSNFLFHASTWHVQVSTSFTRLTLSISFLFSMTQQPCVDTQQGEHRRHGKALQRRRDARSERTGGCRETAVPPRPGEAGVPAVNAVRLVVGGGWLPGFSVTGVRVQAGGGRRLGWHVPRAAAPP